MNHPTNPTILAKHPLEPYNQRQEDFLASLPAGKRQAFALMFTVGNLTYSYSSQAQSFEPTLTDWEEWLAGLPEPVSRDMRAEGFQASKGVLSFNRYVMEKNDVGLEAYLEAHMGPDAYAAYKNLLVDNPTNPQPPNDQCNL